MLMAPKIKFSLQIIVYQNGRQISLHQFWKQKQFDRIILKYKQKLSKPFFPARIINIIEWNLTK